MGVKLSDLSTETSPASSDIMMIADPATGIAKKITVSALKTFLDSLGGAGLTPLSTPTLTATVISSSQIDLSWTNVANESSYMLEWSPNGSSGWTQIGGTIAANTTTYSHTGLTAATAYYYRVKAVGDGVTYSDSGYGTDNDTTSASGPTYLTWSSLGRNAQKNSNKGIFWDGAASGDVFANAVQTLSDGEEVICDVPNVLDDVWAFGVHTAQSVDFTSWLFGCRLNVNYHEYESGTMTDTTVAGVIGDLVKIKYAGTTLTIERSTNSGASWTVISTYSGSASGTYFILFRSNFGGPNNIYKP